jgi:hypothetical protein
MIVTAVSSLILSPAPVAAHASPAPVATMAGVMALGALGFALVAFIAWRRAMRLRMAQNRSWVAYADMLRRSPGQAAKMPPKPVGGRWFGE